MKTLVTALALLLLPLTSHAALNAYLKIRGERGPTTVSSAEIVSPRDAASGQATGKRQHKPVRIALTLPTGSSLLGDLREGATLDSLTFEVAKGKKGKGDKQEYLEIKLTDILVSSYREADGSVNVVLEAAQATNFDHLKTR